jgi:hypothetical protein
MQFTESRYVWNGYCECYDCHRGELFLSLLNYYSCGYFQAGVRTVDSSGGRTPTMHRRLFLLMIRVQSPAWVGVLIPQVRQGTLLQRCVTSSLIPHLSNSLSWHHRPLNDLN